MIKEENEKEKEKDGKKKALKSPLSIDLNAM